MADSENILYVWPIGWQPDPQTHTPTDPQTHRPANDPQTHQWPTKPQSHQPSQWPVDPQNR
jgi:hypothetical protein